MRVDTLPQTNGMLSQKTRKMIYLYAPETVAERKHIYLELVDAAGDENRLEMFQHLDRFSARLKRFGSPNIIIMLAIGEKDLPNIIALKDLFLDAAVIILLSDEDQETYVLAIRLRPKFLGIMNGDMDKITPVVQKLIQKKRNL